MRAWMMAGAVSGGAALALLGVATMAQSSFAQTAPAPAPATSPVTTPATPRPPSAFDMPPTNLTVLPATIDPQQLRGTMVAFSRALGVECQHCHVGRDFASDANPKKNIARAMMRMTWALNNTTLPGIEGLNQTRVSCYSCHRGAVTPALSPPAPAAATPPAPQPAATGG